MLNEWRKTGLGTALNWYKVMATGLMSKDDEGTPLLSSSPPLLAPYFLYPPARASC